MGILPPQLGDYGCTLMRLLDFSIRDPNTIISDRYAPQYTSPSNILPKIPNPGLISYQILNRYVPLTCTLGCLQQVLGAYTYLLIPFNQTPYLKFIEYLSLNSEIHLSSKSNCYLIIIFIKTKIKNLLTESIKSINFLHYS